MPGGHIPRSSVLLGPSRRAREDAYCKNNPATPNTNKDTARVQPSLLATVVRFFHLSLDIRNRAASRVVGGVEVIYTNDSGLSAARLTRTPPASNRRHRPLIKGIPAAAYDVPQSYGRGRAVGFLRTLRGHPAWVWMLRGRSYRRDVVLVGVPGYNAA